MCVDSISSFINKSNLEETQEKSTTVSNVQEKTKSLFFLSMEGLYTYTCQTLVSNLNAVDLLESGDEKDQPFILPLIPQSEIEKLAESRQNKDMTSEIDLLYKICLKDRSGKYLARLAKLLIAKGETDLAAFYCLCVMELVSRGLSKKWTIGQKLNEIPGYQETTAAFYKLKALNFVDACSEFDRLLKNNSQNCAARFGFICSLRALNKYQEALQEIELLKAHSDPLVQAASEFIEAETFLYKKDFEKSKQCYRAILQQDNLFQELAALGLMQCLIMLGILFQFSRRISKIIGALDGSAYGTSLLKKLLVIPRKKVDSLGFKHYRVMNKNLNKQIDHPLMGYITLLQAIWPKQTKEEKRAAYAESISKYRYHSARLLSFTEPDLFESEDVKEINFKLLTMKGVLPQPQYEALITIAGSLNKPEEAKKIVSDCLETSSQAREEAKNDCTLIAKALKASSDLFATDCFQPKRRLKKWEKTVDEMLNKVKLIDEMLNKEKSKSQERVSGSLAIPLPKQKKKRPKKRTISHIEHPERATVPPSSAPKSEFAIQQAKETQELWNRRNRELEAELEATRQRKAIKQAERERYQAMALKAEVQHDEEKWLQDKIKCTQELEKEWNPYESLPEEKDIKSICQEAMEGERITWENYLASRELEHYLDAQPSDPEPLSPLTQALPASPQTATIEAKKIKKIKAIRPNIFLQDRFQSSKSAAVNFQAAFETFKKIKNDNSIARDVAFKACYYNAMRLMTALNPQDIPEKHHLQLRSLLQPLGITEKNIISIRASLRHNFYHLNEERLLPLFKSMEEYKWSEKLSAILEGIPFKKETWLFNPSILGISDEQKGMIELAIIESFILQTLVEFQKMISLFFPIEEQEIFQKLQTDRDLLSAIKLNITLLGQAYIDLQDRKLSQPIKLPKFRTFMTMSRQVGHATGKDVVHYEYDDISVSRLSRIITELATREGFQEQAILADSGGICINY